MKTPDSQSMSALIVVLLNKFGGEVEITSEDLQFLEYAHGAKVLRNYDPEREVITMKLVGYEGDLL